MKNWPVRLALLVATLFLFTNSHAQTLQWVKGGGTTIGTTDDIEATTHLCTDVNGNVYALSQVQYNAVTADTLSGTDYGYESFVIESYNCQGQIRWAKLIASSSAQCFGFGIVADTLGHVYVGGFLPDGVLHIGHDTAIYPNDHIGLGMMQFDTSGHFKWIRHVGNSSLTSLAAVYTKYGSISLDNANLPHLIATLGNGSALVPGDTSRRGTYDISFTVSGNVFSVKRLALDSTLFIVGATVDRQSNDVYAYGYRTAAYSVCCGGDSSIYNFIAGFDTSGHQKWVDTVADYLDATEGIISGITADGNGHLYSSLVGFGYLTIEGDTTFASFGLSYLTGILQIDTSGHKVWFSGFEGNHSGLADITLLNNGNVAAIGSFTGIVMDDMLDTISSTSGDPFIYKIDTAGNPIDLKAVNGSGTYDWGYSIACDKVGNLFIGGTTNGTLPTGAGITTYTTEGGSDFFFMRYGVDCDCTSMPVANFSFTGNPVVSFIYTGTTGVDSIRWHFGDGGTDTSHSPTHTYTAPGLYTITAKVFSPCGSDIHYATIYVPCVAPPIAAFSDTGISLVKHFTYTASSYGLDSVVWNYGDGNSGSGLASAHTYAVGTYTACAAAYNACGVDSICHTVTVINCAGLPSASYTQTGVGASHSFTYTGPATYLDSVVWHFGDGGHATGSTASHTYSSTGTYTACVSVYTACGFDSSCATVSVPCVSAPTPAFTTSGSSAVRNFAYTGTTADSVIWHYGDGGHGSGTSSAHTYTDTGTFTACALAYNACGVDSICHTVTIHCVTAPLALFTDTGTYAMGYTSTGTTIGVDSVTWNFGDGQAASGSSASNIFPSPGSYYVCVTAHSGCGSSTACDTVTVACLTSPTSAFTASGALPLNLTYTGSTQYLDSIVWEFGDGLTDTGFTASHSFAVSDTYNVCVTVYTACGADSVCHPEIVTGVGIGGVFKTVNDISVFPNPATDEVIVRSTVDGVHYTLSNVTGIVLQTGLLRNREAVLSLKAYAPGMYLLKTILEDGSVNTFRIVKER